MKLLPGNQAIAQYTPQQPLIYDAEIVEIYPEPVAEIDFFKCPTAADVAQAERELEASSKLSYWDWLKSVLG
jgi:hypothetical protein